MKGKFRSNFVYEGGTLVLIDDVYTTGATTDEITRVLKESGIQEVLVLAIAKTGSRHRTAIQTVPENQKQYQTAESRWPAWG